MEDTGLSKEILEELTNIAKNYPKYEFYIFGSRAKFSYKNNSDIYIAVFENVDEKDEFKIRNDFDLLNIIYKIDLVFITKNTKEELLKSINNNKIKIY